MKDEDLREADRISEARADRLVRNVTFEGVSFHINSGISEKYVFIVWRWYIYEEPDIVAVVFGKSLAKKYAAKAQNHCKRAGIWDVADEGDAVIDGETVFWSSAPDTSKVDIYREFDENRYFVSIERHEVETE